MNDVKQKITFILPGYITVPMGGVKVVNRLAELLSQRNYDVILVYPKLKP
jgi:predicted CoA-binding protein